MSDREGEDTGDSTIHFYAFRQSERSWELQEGAENSVAEVEREYDKLLKPDMVERLKRA